MLSTVSLLAMRYGVKVLRDTRETQIQYLFIFGFWRESFEAKKPWDWERA